jgi:hypothetical protein
LKIKLLFKILMYYIIIFVVSLDVAFPEQIFTGILLQSLLCIKEVVQMFCAWFR